MDAIQDIMIEDKRQAPQAGRGLLFLDEVL